MTRQIVPDNVISDFLNTILIDTKFFIVDIWSFVHLFAGGILALLLDNPFKVLLVLVAWELFELAFIGVAFRQEPLRGILADIGFGMLGFFAVKGLRRLL